jgi:hypothetical protein
MAAFALYIEIAEFDDTIFCITLIISLKLEFFPSFNSIFYKSIIFTLEIFNWFVVFTLLRTS